MADVLQGTVPYVAPDSFAAKQVQAWRSSRPADAAQMQKIASQGIAHWIGDWTRSPASEVSARITAAENAKQIAVFAVYNIPIRDNNGYSGGGASSAAEYRAFIDEVGKGMGGRRNVVILEADALAHMNLLPRAKRIERYQLLSYATRILSGSGATVYIDAAHSRWVRADIMARRLIKANVAAARGFALNVSNFQTTEDNIRHGKAISSRIGGKQFVIDTSRNGNGWNGQWCDPEGRALGARPTSSTADPLVDAYLWIKIPGTSDGCLARAGTWLPEYALGLARRAAY